MLFADDIVLSRQNDRELENDLEIWRKSLERRGLKVSRSKTEYLKPMRRDSVVVRASASHLVDLGLNPLVELNQKTLKNDIHSFPAWRSAFREGCGEQAGKFACVLGQGT